MSSDFKSYSYEDEANYDVWRELRIGFRHQALVIWALFFKEYKIRLGTSRLGILWAILEPITSMLAVSAIWLIIGREKIEGVQVMLYIGAGFAVFILVRKGINPVPRAIIANIALLNYDYFKYK